MNEEQNLDDNSEEPALTTNYEQDDTAQTITAEETRVFYDDMRTVSQQQLAVSVLILMALFFVAGTTLANSFWGKRDG